MKTKYILLLFILIGFTACNDEEDFVDPVIDVNLPALTAGSADFSNYVAVGASFTAGFTDNALFIAGQQNSFPNILSGRFALAGGGNFNQPLMNDNVGGFLFGGMPLFDANGNRLFGPRLFFDGEGPVTLPAESSTEATTVLTGPFNNIGVPGTKSFHLAVSGYGALNPYFGRMASNPAATIIGDALAQNPTFFTISEIGGNDVLFYALAGGDAVDQTGNLNPLTYGLNDITDPNVFAAAFSATVDALVANGAKGVVGNVPYITSMSHFTTVPHNPLDPTDEAFGPQIPTLNLIYGALNEIFIAFGETNRVIVFSEDDPESEDDFSALVIKDETLDDFSGTITGILANSPEFAALIGQFGLPPAAAPTVANILGQLYGQCRQATADDLFVLPSSSVIGELNLENIGTIVPQLMAIGVPLSSAQQLAGQFSVEGITFPLEDKWCLIPSEQNSIRVATDAYNETIAAVANANDLAIVDLKNILIEASTMGYPSNNFILTTDLVTGGAIGLDGVHLTSRGYAAMANAILRAIDEKYGSNFEASGNLVDVGDYPTNYPPSLQ